MTETIFPHFRLEQWNSMRLQLLWAYQKPMNMQQDVHHAIYDFQTAALVQKGWAEAGSKQDKVIRAEKGQWLLYHQGERWQRFSQDCVILSIGFRFQFPTGDAVFNRGLPVTIASREHPPLKQSAQNILQAMEAHIGTGFLRLKEQVDLQNYMHAQNALRLFLIEFAHVCQKQGIRASQTGHSNPHVMAALEMIEATPISENGKPLKPGSIAKSIGIHPVYLDRLMVEETGLTTFQQIDKRRLQIAQDALIANQDHLKAIAYSLGFSSPAHFSSWFKQRTQCTPFQFRKQG